MTVAGQGSPFFDSPEQFLTVGHGLAARGKGEAARAWVMDGLAANPGSKLHRELGRLILSHGMDDFHLGMLQDSRRNALYRQAIEKVAPGRVVLDIGTGSGLLSMIAARAGAERVVTCEFTPTMAATARAIIAANGLADRITVHDCHSNRLDRDRDLAGGADLVVSEIFASDVVGESMQPSLEHARTHLCRPDALFVPPAGQAVVVLACDPHEPGPLGEVEGFDLSALNGHLEPMRRVKAWDPDLVLCSEPADLFSFAYRAGEPIAQTGRASVRLAARGGRVTGVLQWLRIDFGDGLVYENAPGPDRTPHWELFYHPFDNPRDLSPGELVEVHGFFHRHAMVVWAD
ncbi:50S ribosomal protein L11 methyltransferase [Alteraurantiacibacter buctensis]|uniref:Methyltransferase domain-containing protein n=1 Tax=Alteraurantiacibacter buctensis TaxID=1503981 RepID=A0A844YTD0_9SPHN|nr:50S ribosomal protein L11 methyltransferase [Alteraurantiacibacter buctensis]MXO70310.1 methyltransferase domain-containing protein [Alteraurantiacibacter buctensis]